jgi:hypothetical protein
MSSGGLGAGVDLSETKFEVKFKTKFRTKLLCDCSGGEPAKHAKYAKRPQELHVQSLGRFACFECFAG